MLTQPAEGAPQTTDAKPGERVVSDSDKKLAADWLKRIDGALKRVDTEFKKFGKNRRLLKGRKGSSTDDESAETVRANLHYGNMAAMVPQIYAKDPEFAATPSKGVSTEQLLAAKRFAETAEFMLQKVVVKDANLKKTAKKVIRSTYPTAVGWIKASWQERKKTDPLIANRIKDTQDNIDRIEMLLSKLEDPAAGSDHELQLAQLKQTLAGLETQQEVTVAKGIALDFVMSEDIVVIDPSIRSVTDYARATAIGHRVWITPDQFRSNFGYDCKKGRSYKEQSGAMSAADGGEKDASLLCVWEIWSQDDNRIYYVCDGEEGFCKGPSSPEWTGKRWYPFFLVAFNEIDGSFYPLSDIDLTDKLVCEYNQNREDAVRDREACLPVNIVRKGGSLTPDDVKRIANRKGSDLIMVEGVGGQPLQNDIFVGQLGKMDPMAYDTAGCRYDMERVLGGGDSNTGSITKAKTATEAEILSQGLQSRSAERRDTLEDMFNELGPYCLEIMLRKFSEQEVKAMAGPDSAWPQLSIDDIFNLVTVEVRGGSTGKPDKLQEQDRWTKLLPIINEAVAKIAELREKGQDHLAQAVIEITRETMRRFDERLDIESFLPKKPQGEDDPVMLKQQMFAMRGQLEQVMGDLQKAKDQIEKGYVSAAAQIATSPAPMVGAAAFQTVLGQITQEQPAPGMEEGQGGEPLSPQPAETVLQ